MRERLANVVRRAPGHYPASSMDQLLYDCSLVAPRFHFAFEFVLRTPLAKGALRDGLRRTVARLPILGSRFVVGALGARWSPVGEDVVPRLLLPPLELSPSDHRSLRAALRRAREAALDKPLETRAGKPCRIHRFNLPTGQQRLLVVCHPMVADPLGWLQILNELFAQMQQVAAEETEPPAPSRAAKGSRSMSALLMEQPRLSQRSAWSSLRDLAVFRTDVRCLWDTVPPDSRVTWRPVRLKPDRLKLLKEEALLAGGSVGDALIATVAQTFDRTDLGLCRNGQGNALLRIALGIDTRRFARRRLGVGNFTSVQVCTLDLPLPGTLTAITMQLRPQIERALEQRSALQALMPLVFMGQIPPALSSRLVSSMLRTPLPVTSLVLDLGRLEERLRAAEALPIRRVTFFPPAAGFLPSTVSISSWHGALTVNAAFARDQLALEEIDTFTDVLRQRIATVAGTFTR